ncbi:MAG: polyhydroxyalkanoate synthesis repressor PhaR [Proteobacteria bacterium]|nr:polyhydroxyalkanoate synthesis repressor PhaR [Pseudomonadota bacterium]
MSEPRVIKKYPNRRLYDTFESRYITLAEIKRLVIDRTDFLVIDKKSNRDITRSILLQVISDEEQQGAPALSQEFLANVIRTYGDASREQLAVHLEQGMRNFCSQHLPSPQ